jgi:ADP-L-glycero-D-manno-heptose 6-epimerase
VALASVNTALKLRGEAPLAIAQLVERGYLEYIGFPEALVGKYQCHTQADMSRLRAAGCPVEFTDVATGVARYIAWLSSRENAT